jgi:O-antigen/teichoic acid export membrane protein
MLRIALLKGIGWNGFALIINRSFPLFLTIILASFLTPAELGEVSFVLSWLVVLSVFADWGVAVAFQKYIQEYSGKDDLILSTALAVRVCFTLFVCALCWLTDSATGIFRGYGFRLMIALLSTIMGSGIFILNAQFRYVQFSMLLILQSFVWFVSSLAMVWFGLRINGPIFGSIIGNVAVGIAFCLMIPGISTLFKFDSLIAGKIITFGFWATIITGINTFTTQAGVLMLPYLANPTEGGIFRVATLFSSAPIFLGNAIVFPFLPLCKKVIMNNRDDASKLVTLFMRYLILFGCFSVSITLMLADAIVRSLTHSAYIRAVSLLKIMAFASVPMMLFIVFSTVLFIGEGVKDLSKINAFVAGGILVGNRFLIPVWGGFGAAIVSLLAFLFGFALIMRWLKKNLQVQMEWRKYLSYVFCAIETIVALRFILMFFRTSILQLLGGFAFGCVFFALCLYMHRGFAMKDIRALLQYQA